MVSGNLPPGVNPAWAAQNNLPKILAITSVIHILALISVGLRLYVRIGLLRTPGKDDAFITAAAICTLGGWICFILQGYHGLGRHTLTISQHDLMEFERLNFAQGVISAMGAMGLLKISIAFFLLRLNKTDKNWYTKSLWALIALVCLYTVGAWLSFFLRCTPMAGFWDRDIVARCVSMDDFMKIAQVNTGLNIFTDVCFATLPIPIIWNLHMSSRTRINIIAVLSLGYIAVALGIVKAIYQMVLTKNPDRHYDQHIQFWGFLQLNVGIIAASVPTYKPLLKRGAPSPSEDEPPSDGGLARSRGTVTTKPSKTGWSFLAQRRVVPYGGSYDLSEDSTATRMTNKQNTVYNGSRQRTESEEQLSEREGRQSADKQIVCTTEVVIEDARRTSPV